MQRLETELSTLHDHYRRALAFALSSAQQAAAAAAAAGGGGGTGMMGHGNSSSISSSALGFSLPPPPPTATAHPGAAATTTASTADAGGAGASGVGAAEAIPIHRHHHGPVVAVPTAGTGSTTSSATNNSTAPDNGGGGHEDAPTARGRSGNSSGAAADTASAPGGAGPPVASLLPPGLPPPALLGRPHYVHQHQHQQHHDVHPLLLPSQPPLPAGRRAHHPALTGSDVNVGDRCVNYCFVLAWMRGMCLCIYVCGGWNDNTCFNTTRYNTTTPPRRALVQVRVQVWHVGDYVEVRFFVWKHSVGRAYIYTPSPSSFHPQNTHRHTCTPFLIQTDS